MTGRDSADDAVDETVDETVDRIECRAYEIATDRPEADGTLAWSSTTVVVVLARAAGVVGTGWTYSSAGSMAIVDEELARVAVGARAIDVSRIHEEMVRACRNLGRPGVVSCAISAVDTALWDLKAKLLGTSVATLAGSGPTSVPVYGSGGFTTYDDHTAAGQLEHWVGQLGIPRVKIKIGESWGTRVERDLARVSLARRVVGDGVELYADANGGYRRKQAIRVGRRLFDDSGVVWFEEPVSSDDLVGLGQVRAQVAPDVAAGEYGYDDAYFARMVESGSVDCLQVDATRCGGYTSWLRAAAVARAHNLDVSAHCAPHLHSAVAGAIANLRHVEYFHDHVRVDQLLFDGLPQIADGALSPLGGVVGHGMSLKDRDAEPFRVQ